MKNHRQQGTYSIAEARDNLSRIVHEAEVTGAVELTRRGRPVVVLLSVSAYRRLSGHERDLWAEILTFRAREDVARDGVEPDAFEGVRDRGLGGEVNW